MKKVICIIFAILFNLTSFAKDADWRQKYAWAEDSVDFCVSKNILQGDEYGNYNLGNNLTRSEMAKMVSVGIGVKSENTELFYEDVPKSQWAYKYIINVQDFIADKSEFFRPFDYATREEFFSCVMYALRFEETDMDILEEKFSDWDKISNIYKKSLAASVKLGYVVGNDGMLRPSDNLTRAEVCVFLDRILNEDKKSEDTQTKEDGLLYEYSETPILGQSEHSLEQMVSWAKSKGAHQRFIDAAPLYWHYGEIFGIRADVMYAQAAKETGFGKYGGRVLPEMNNWAGIKKYGATGDETEDHETFLTPDDGVRGHFNHMSAYVGVDPVGETHGRYKSVKSLKWAGTVEFVEQLGGRWCPDINYGYSILHDYVNKMS